MKKITMSLIALSCVSTLAMAEGKVGTYIDGSFGKVELATWGISGHFAPISHEWGFVGMFNQELGFTTRNSNKFSKEFNEGNYSDIKHKMRERLSGNIGWQFGTPVGGFALLPVGFEFNADFLSSKNTTNNKKETEYYMNLAYLGGVSYKLNLNKHVILNAKALYNHAFTSTTSFKNSKMDNYEPNGMSYEADIDWKINKHLGLNLKVRYEDLTYKLIKNTHKTPYSNGVRTSIGVNYMW